MKQARISYPKLEKIGRLRLSKTFFLRDFLHSEIAAFYGLANAPDDVDLAVAAGTRLCEEILEPLQDRFGRLHVRSGFRSCEVNAMGNEKGHNCATNEKNYAGHIWDRRDVDGCMGATACVVVPWFADRYEKGEDWRSLAWWIHDHLPYSQLCFFPIYAAFNISWHEQPGRLIRSFVKPKGTLTKPGMENHEGSHAKWYAEFP
jgi:hypothetical protein